MKRAKHVKPWHRLVVASAFVAAMAVIPAALAAPGCNPAVARAQHAAAKARVAIDVAKAEQIIMQPDSLLVLTCAHQAFGVSARTGGALFSGDFTSGLSGVVQDAMRGHLTNNFSKSVGVRDGLFNMAGHATLSAPYNCQNLARLQNHLVGTGIDGKVVQITYDDIMKNSIPAGAGDVMQANLRASAAVFTEMRNAVNSLPRPEVPDFSSDKSLCDVLKRAGAGACE